MAWDIHDHIMSRLSTDERQQIHQAQRIALRRVISQAKEESSLSHSSNLGYPPVQLAEVFYVQLDVA